MKKTLFTCTCCDQFIWGEGFVDNFDGELVGVLCTDCARAVTVMRENPSRLLKVSKYLVRINEWPGEKNE